MTQRQIHAAHSVLFALKDCGVPEHITTVHCNVGAREVCTITVPGTKTKSGLTNPIKRVLRIEIFKDGSIRGNTGKPKTNYMAHIDNLWPFITGVIRPRLNEIGFASNP